MDYAVLLFARNGTIAIRYQIVAEHDDGALAQAAELCTFEYEKAEVWCGERHVETMNWIEV